MAKREGNSYTYCVHSKPIFPQQFVLIKNVHIILMLNLFTDVHIDEILVTLHV